MLAASDFSSSTSATKCHICFRVDSAVCLPQIPTIGWNLLVRDAEAPRVDALKGLTIDVLLITDFDL